MIALLAGVAVASHKEKSSKRYIITPDSDADADEIKDLVDVHHELRGVFSAEIPKKKLSAVKELASVRPVKMFMLQKHKEARQKRKCTPTEQVPWNIQMVNGGSGGAGITIAVLDSGVNKGHIDLSSNIKKCLDMTGGRAGGNCKDTIGHGTEVIGIIAGMKGRDGLGIVGVAPQSSIMSLRVCDKFGFCAEDDIAAGIYYAADRGANIVSMSLGGSEDTDVIRDAVAYAAGRGVLLVAAAGNEGPYDDSIGYPAAYPEVIAVAAIDEEGNIADFSSRGLNDGDEVIEEREIEFVAPGVAVESTAINGCYDFADGTSFAAPHISGLAAKLWQGSAAATRAYLQQLALAGEDFGQQGDDAEAGLGMPVAP